MIGRADYEARRWRALALAILATIANTVNDELLATERTPAE